MKKVLTILLLLYSSNLYAQVSDDFTDSNFTNNPVWTGSNNSTDFTIIDNKLRSNSSLANSSFFLSTESTLVTNTQWEFWVNLQFSTSGSNYTDIYVISDKADLKASLINGYFIRIGNTDDEISFYKRSGTSSTIVKLIDGLNGSTGSTSTIVKIKLRRENGGNFTLHREIVSGNSSYFNEGNVVDLTHTTSSHFGFLVQQSTSSFFLKHFFDNIKIESIITDTVAPSVISVANIDSNTLEVQFNEPMDSVSTKTVTNYLLNNNSGSVLKIATTNDPAKFILKLSKGLSSGTYLLTVANVKDRNDNIINQNNHGSFVYAKPYVYKIGDVVINEIFADPTPQIDLPSVEFVELRNNTNERLSLKNWKFSDSGTSTAFGEIDIDPHSLLIICAKADTADYKLFGRVIGLSPWPSLNNSGEILKLLSPDNRIIDSVSYSDSWYRGSVKKQGGWSLERRDPKSKCEGRFNWFASVDSSGGTPGRQNSIYVQGYDEVALKADSLKQLSDTSITISFNKHLDEASLLSENFKLTPGLFLVKKITADLDRKSIVLTFDKKLPGGIDHYLQIQNVKECSGILTNSQLESIKFTSKKPLVIPPTVDTAELIISEIFADPSPEVHLPLTEFIEIYNPSKDTVDLDKWTLRDATTIAIIRGQKILPKQFIILCPMADTTHYKTFGRVIGLNPWPSLNNVSDQIVLKSQRNRLVDSVSYSDNWYKNNSKKSGGWSIEKIDLTSVCEDFLNWTASIDTNGGTPGTQNSVNIYGYDDAVLKADSLKLTSDTTLIVYFSKHLDSSTMLSENFKLIPDNSIKIISSESGFREVKLTFNKKFESGTEYQLFLSGLKDCSGNSLTGPSSLKLKTNQATPPPIEKPDTATIIITEIFADPSPEVHLPLVEFIEIYNPSKDTVDLDKWKLTDPTTTAQIPAKKILPLEYVILCPVADTAHYKPYGKTIGLNPWPSLNNASDQITIKSFKNRVVDSIAYSDSWYKSNSKKTGGWSLERIDLKSNCEGIFNWTASVDTIGGTPGRQNSNYILGYDAIILKADSLKLITDSTVKIYFNKHLNSATLVVENFQLVPETNTIKKITSDNNLKEVTLTYHKNFQLGVEYKISFSNLKDCSGTTINSSSNFIFKTISPPLPIPERIDTAKILITEIFADPSPEVHLPLVEFIEIYNPSKDTVDLDKWRLTDPTTTAQIRTQKILPLEYVILCPVADTTHYKPYGRTIGLNPWPSLNNTSDQITIKSFKNRVVDSLVYKDTWYKSKAKKGGGWSLEKIDLASKCEDLFNWIASIDTTGGTPGRVNSVNILGYDFLALKADSLNLTSDTTVKLFFNKHLNPATLLPQAFTLTPVNFIKNITSDEGIKEITLTFKRRLEPGQEYSLMLSNLKDCSGNDIISSLLHFKLPALVPEKADTATILITEIFADPSPEIGLPLAEFIELFNPGLKTVELTNWSISDASTKGIITNTSLKPGEHLILCPIADTLLYKPFGKTKGLTPWPTLGNNGDQIMLKSFRQRLVDSVAYSDKWYKNRTKKNGGWSLERINPLKNTCNGFYNWVSSYDESGGTPGRSNSTGISSTPRSLQVDSLQITSDSTSIVYFSSIPDTSYLKPAYFNINNQIGKAISIYIEDDYKKIHLSFGSKFQEGQTYILTADSLFNCFGEKTNDPDNYALFTIPRIPEIDYPVIITEIFADPTPRVGLPESEFVELYNPSEKSVSIKGMYYGDENLLHQFTYGEIAAKSYLILCSAKDTSNFSQFGKVLGLPVWPSLGNERDVLILKNNKGRELHRVAYNTSWYKDISKKTGGYSLELINYASVCKDSQNWAASKDATGGTPGIENSIRTNSTQDGLKLLEVELTDTITLTLFFNKAVDSLSASILANYQLNNGVGMPVVASPMAPEFEHVVLKFNAPLARGRSYKITASNLKDCAGTAILSNFSSLDFILTEKILKKDILVNEILFNPRTGGVDFVEIYNDAKHTLDLQELSIATVLKDTVSNKKRVSLKQLLFEPGHYMVLTSDPEIIKKEYRVENPDKFLKITLPQFSDDKGTVVLINNEGRVDQLDYSEKMHFQLLNNFDGVSLERSSFEMNTNQAGNFRSATAASGFATPGFRNSQYSEITLGNEEFALVSRTFSPDNDGFEDLLQISYNMPATGLVANVKIFNDNGVLIKNLLKNSTLNSTGVLVWDGVNEFNTAAVTGIYTIYAEIFDTNGNVKKFRRSFALAAKF